MCDFCFSHLTGRQQTLPGLRQTSSPESSLEHGMERGYCCSLGNDEIDFGAIADQHIGLDSAQG